MSLKNLINYYSMAILVASLIGACHSHEERIRVPLAKWFVKGNRTSYFTVGLATLSPIPPTHTQHP